MRQRSPRPDPNPVPAASAQARLSAPDAPTAVAAARASTAWVWATAAQGARGGLAVSLAEEPVRLSGEFPGAAVVLRSGCSAYLVALAQSVIPHTVLLTLPAAERA